MKPWRKLHTQMLSNPKYIQLNDDDRLFIYESLLSTEDDGYLPEIASLAYTLHRPQLVVAECVKSLISIGWLEDWDDGIRWSKLQTYQVSTSTERVRKHRAMKRSETLRNVSVTDETVPLKDKEVDLEEEEIKKKKGLGTDVPLSPGCPATPYKEIASIYHEVLPELPLMKVWTAQRKKMMQTRWREDAARQDLDAWRKLFEMIRKCPHLMGDNDRGWTLTLPWLLKAENFAKVLEGNYYKRQDTERQLLGDKASRTAANARKALGLEEE